MRESNKDFGYGGFERGNEASDRVQREAYPHQKRERSAYYATVGDIPTLHPSDYTGAKIVLDRIRAAIHKGGWTRNEWRRLRSLESKWAARAEGKDKRFNLVGNRKGGLTREQKYELYTSVSTDEIKEIIKKSKDGKVEDGSNGE